VDDEEAIRTLLRTALESVGLEVSEATNGRDGLALYRQQPADLVITDIGMPEGNGLDLILELTREYFGVKVIAMSGEQETRHLNAAKLLGARQTLQKPFSLDKLLQTVLSELAN
jgi:two-component system response regulator (stage 0 sporulation protein F)